MDCASNSVCGIFIPPIFINSLPNACTRRTKNIGKFLTLLIYLSASSLRGPAESQRARIFTPGKKKTWNGSGKKAGVQNGEEGFDLRKTQLMQHEYFVFHALNLCPPDCMVMHLYNHLE
jgi:hypothetical protein